MSGQALDVRPHGILQVIDNVEERLICESGYLLSEISAGVRAFESDLTVLAERNRQIEIAPASADGRQRRAGYGVSSDELVARPFKDRFRGLIKIDPDCSCATANNSRISEGIVLFHPYWLFFTTKLKLSVNFMLQNLI